MISQQKRLEEVSLIVRTLGLAARNNPPQDAIHANNVRLLLSRYEIMSIETQDRAAKSIQNVMRQIHDPSLHSIMLHAIKEKISGWS